MKNTALLIVDMQNDLVKAQPYDIDKVIGNIKILVSTCRENNIKVIYIQHNGETGDDLHPNTDGWNIYNEIGPNVDEKVITKNYNSAFKDTGLKEYLTSKQINQLIITGMQTDYCFDTTCKIAFEYGYKVIIPEKTNTTFDNGNLSAKELYEHYNYNIFDDRFGTVESMEKTIERIRK